MNVCTGVEDDRVHVFAMSYYVYVRFTPFPPLFPTDLVFVFVFPKLDIGDEADGGPGATAQGARRDVQPVRVHGQDFRTHDVLLQRRAVQRKEDRSRALLLPRLPVNAVALVLGE